MLPVALVVAMLAVTPLGLWQMDELFTIRTFHLEGIPGLLHRIVIWSPRPFSELLLYLYSEAVNATGRQLTGTFLLGLWIMLIAACLMPAAAIRTAESPRRGVSILVALTVLALLVSGHPIAEVFYWPQGAGAYIPTIAFIVAPLLCMTLAGQRSTRLDALTAVCFGLAALSSEVGAFFAVAWGALAPSILWVGRWLRAEDRIVRRSDLPFLAPLVAGLGVLYLLANARFGNEAELANPVVARQLGASLWWTLKTFPSDITSTDLGPSTAMGIALGFTGKIALLGLCALAFRRSATTSVDLRLLMAALALAALAGALFSLFAGYYQFGVNCCQRHQTFRSQLVVVAIVALGWLLAQRPIRARLRRRRETWIAVMSIVAVAASGAHVAAALLADISNYRQILQARSANWSEGMSADPKMTFRLSHRGEAIGGVFIPTGTFGDADSTPRPIRAMMHYFGKTKITVE